MLDQNQGSVLNQGRIKVVAAKGKLKMSVNRVTEDSRTRRNVGGRNFKVYSENEMVKEDSNTIKNSVPVKNGAALASASNAKGIVNKMENNKGKDANTASSKVGRKALVDVSNIKGNVPRSVVHDGSKSLKGERSAILQQVSVGSGVRTVNVSSRKSFTGRVRKNISQDVGAIHTSKKGNFQFRNFTFAIFLAEHCIIGIFCLEDNADVKGSKSSLNDKHTKTKDMGRETVVTANRMSRNPPVPTRKSLPVFKRVNQSITSTSKPIVKTAILASNARGTSKSKCLSSLKKSKSIAATSTKKKKDVVRSSPLENIASVVSHEAIQGKPSIDGNTNPSTNSSDIISKKKSDRRRSYTSLLMAKSKLIDENGEVKMENLPGIDDDCNQLEVAEYVDEIYHYYWVMEAQNPPLENYMSSQTDITPQMRGILINWLIEVHLKFDLMPETLYLMVILLDRYLSEVKIKKNEMQLVGLTSLLLASKYEDFWHPRVKDLISISETYTRDHMLRMEKLMLKKLKFRLNVPTPYVFMLRFLKAAQSDTKLEHLAFYLVELSLVQYEALKFKPSLLCASAIYVARCTLQMTPVWTPLLAKHAQYDVPQIRDCAEMILKFHKVAKNAQLKVTFEKYMRPDLSGVAAIKPLDRLPL
ncbi:putative cyclin-B3-1 [Citrus sinensis]|uniref:Cyclin-B3-1 n=1 Tax=Citrus sinensis TaxID=2711 RepID=A0ACB8HQV6_CITSI|nr:putative cyclin-B3-1 [Citrus sinensis]